MLIYGLLAAAYALLFWWSGKNKEKNFGINIYRTANANIHTAPEDNAPLNYRWAQLAQFGLLCGIESIFGVAVGALYGPYIMLWWLAITLLFGAGLNYYSGITTLASGKLLPMNLQNKINKPLFMLLTSGLIIFLLINFTVNYSFLQHACGTVFLPSFWWHGLLLAILLVAVCRQYLFNIFCLNGGIIVLLSSAYLIYHARSALQTWQFNWQWQNYPDLQYAYPLCFFAAAACTVSGIQSLKSALLAPSIKNEKMGRNVFWLIPLLHTFFVILWLFLLNALLTSKKDLRNLVNHSLSPYDIWENILSAAAPHAKYLFFALIFYMGILSCGAILRILLRLTKESKILPIKNEISATLLLISMAILLYCTYSSLYFYELSGQLITIIMFGCTAYLLSVQHKKSADMHSGFIIWIGSCAAYFMWMILPFDYLLGTIFGISITLLLVIYKILRQKIL